MAAVRRRSLAGTRRVRRTWCSARLLPSPWGTRMVSSLSCKRSQRTIHLLRAIHDQLHRHGGGAQGGALVDDANEGVVIYCCALPTGPCSPRPRDPTRPAARPDQRCDRPRHTHDWTIECKRTTSASLQCRTQAGCICCLAGQPS
jgi:hypothetical protein